MSGSKTDWGRPAIVMQADCCQMVASILKTALVIAMTSDSTGELGGSATSKIRTQESADRAAVWAVLVMLRNDLSGRLRRGVQMFFSGKWHIDYICNVLKVCLGVPLLSSCFHWEIRVELGELPLCKKVESAESLYFHASL